MALAGINSVNGLGVNPSSGDVYVTSTSTSRVFVLGASTAPTASMGVSGVNVHSAQLTGLINPGGPDTAIGIRTNYHFGYREIGAPTWTPLSGDLDAGNSFTTVPVVATLNDLEADTAYEARLVVSKPFSGVANIVTAPQPFTTPTSGPEIDSAYVTDRQNTAAVLNTRINPNNSPTSYRFEYGPTAAYGANVPAPDANAGSGTAAQLFSQAITGLTPGATYHYRVVATNANATTRSPDQTFTTPTASQPQTGRAFELVSPADKIGGQGVGAWYRGPGSHGTAGYGAYDGERYASFAFYGGVLVDGGYSYGSDWALADRTPQGWINRPAFNRRGGYGDSEPYKIAILGGASSDMSLTSWTSTNVMLRLFPEQESWATTVAGGELLREWGSGRWEPIGPTDLATQSPNPAGGFASGVFTEFTQLAADGVHAVVSGPMRGLEGPGDPTLGSAGELAATGRSVYFDDVSAGLSDTFPGVGVRSLVNVCTGSGAARTVLPSVDGDGRIAERVCPVPGSGDQRLIDGRGAALGVSGQGVGQSVISRDGSRVFFMSPDPGSAGHNASCSGAGDTTQCPPQLYVRQRNPGGSVTTRWISRPQVLGQAASLMSEVRFEGASDDGDKVFFRTAAPLTADDPNAGAQVPGGVKTGTPNPNSVDLYLYDLPDAPGADPGEGTLIRVSAGPDGVGDGNVSSGSTSATPAGVGGGLRLASAEGMRAYFVTTAAIAGVPAASSGAITPAGGTTDQTATKNLYLYDAHRQHDDRWRFVAQLPASTPLGSCASSGQVRRLALQAEGNGLGDTKVNSPYTCVQGSSDGAFISFWTDGRLTGDDPDSSSGDVYAYDAEAHELSRVSAPQGGAGGAYTCTEIGGHQCFADMAIGDGNTPGSVMPLSVVTDPEAAGDRVVFFESASRLVPEDQNDVYDVYQWRNGELSLVSTGASGAEDALYRGNDRTGRNVYVSTRERLTWQDHDAVLDVYTARTGGGIPEVTVPSVCALLTGSCQGGGAASATPTVQTHGSPPAGNADPGARATLKVAKIGAKARRVAARRGVLAVRVRSNQAGKVIVVAHGRVGNRVRRLGRGSVTLPAPGAATAKVRLNRPARSALRSGRALRVEIAVRSVGARQRSLTVVLKRAGR